MDNLKELNLFPGVKIISNCFIVTGDESYTLFGHDGPGIADILSLEDGWKGLMITPNQVARYTFFGQLKSKIMMQFVDCRDDSITFGQTYSQEILLDPRCYMSIEPGIAHRFESNENLLMRSEPIFLFNETSLGNDRIMVSMDDALTPENLPRVKTSDIKMSHRLSNVLLKMDQQKAEDIQGNSESFIAKIGTDYKRVSIKEKKTLSELALKSVSVDLLAQGILIESF